MSFPIQIRLTGLVAERMRARGGTESDGGGRRKADPPKVRIGAWLRERTTVGWKWIAEKLRLGHWRSAANAVRRRRSNVQLFIPDPYLPGGLGTRSGGQRNLAFGPIGVQVRFMPKVEGAYKLAEAKAKLGRLCDETLRGRPARIIRRGELFELVHIQRPQVRPATAAELHACYDDPEEIRLLNRFGQESL